MLAEAVGNDPLHPALTVDAIQFASSATGTFTRSGSLYLTEGRRIRLSHREGPKIRGPRPGLRRYCVTASGRAYYRELGREVDSVEADLAAMGALQPAEIGVPGTLLEFWDGPAGTARSHLSRGRPVAAPLTQKQLNLLVIGAVLQDNAVVLAGWCAARLP